MRSVCGLVLLAIMLGANGCVHLRPGAGGNAAEGAGAGRDTSSDLAAENKRLRQELDLARKESESLRAALEHRGPGADGPELARQLNAALRELTDLRASYARLQADRAQAAAAGGLNRTDMPGADAKVTGGQRQATDLEGDPTQLRTEISRLRQENATLAAELKQSATAGDTAQSTLAQVTRELAAEKQARIRAEQATELAFAQLRTVTAARSEAAGTAGAMTGSPPAPAPAPTSNAKPPPAGAPATAAPGHPAGTPGPTAANPPNARTYKVQPGDTLEGIAQHYFGSAERWRSIYDANSALLANGPSLAPGMELVIPER